MQTKNNLTVIHHSADFDGLFCREIARLFLPNATLVGWDFADPPLAVPEGEIYILDLPVDRVFGLDYAQGNVPAALTARVTWIDHHASSIANHPLSLRGYRIDGVAACRLAWQWFTGKHNDPWVHPSDWALPGKADFEARAVTEPVAVRLAGEYDVWDRRDPAAQTFQYGLRSAELTEGDWRGLLLLPPAGRGVEELLAKGELLQNYQQRDDARLVACGFLLDFEGLRFLALNTPRRSSTAFAARDVPETGHEALLAFYWNGRQWIVSLYHAQHRTDLDLSQIAVRYGGGGHRGACGFTAATLPWLARN